MNVKINKAPKLQSRAQLILNYFYEKSNRDFFRAVTLDLSKLYYVTTYHIYFIYIVNLYELDHNKYSNKAMLLNIHLKKVGIEYLFWSLFMITVL
jgi:hypothetical protein